MWKWIERIGAIWGALSVLVILLDAIGLLPMYDIYYKKKSEITPKLLVYPGQKIRLSAQFDQSIDYSAIESVKWNLQDSSGKEYANLPQLNEVDVLLLPDYSGLIKITVKASLHSSETRIGTGSIQVVQTKPQKLALNHESTFLTPADWGTTNKKGLEVYAGSFNWLPVSEVSNSQGELRLNTGGRSLQVWDGKIIYRSKQLSTKNNPPPKFKYDSLTVHVSAESNKYRFNP